ncbi:MAG: GTPase ObgE [Acidimicrobiaceae bacterium]|nr:GTPase ObgE [Acidimicrobiaceae bacterium]
MVSSFIDECNLHVTAGDGGAGCVAFRREARVSNGGPCGGDGGAGGDVWLVADCNTASLLPFRDHPHRSATNGSHGRGSNRHGAQGDDLYIKVPVGTIVLDHTSREKLADLSAHGFSWQAARGGDGGRGNARFYSRSCRSPEFAEQGEKGEHHWLRLELKLLADVGIVGFPNSGKSTFISRVSAAKPKIANYPFTTLEPNLGVVRIDDFTELVVADIPGLIAGASDGKGLGHRFLRHVERSRVLLVMIDVSPWALATPTQQLEVLLRELDSYSPELLERPRVVVASRVDLCAEPIADLTSEFSAEPAVESTICVSSVTGEGITEVLGVLVRLVEQSRQSEETESSVVVHRPLGTEITATKTVDGTWLIEGRAAIRAVSLNDVTLPDAMAYIQSRLDDLGVERALARAGAISGDLVRIGELGFEYLPNEVSGIARTAVFTGKKQKSRTMPKSKRKHSQDYNNKLMRSKS